MKTKLIYIVLYLGLAVSVANAEVVNIAVASNFNHPMKHLVSEFESATGHKVKLSFGSSGKIFAQIQHGAPFHIFFSADQDKPLKLEQAKFAQSGSRFTYAIGRLALWSSKNFFLDHPQQRLKSGDFNRLALANPKLAPYGAAAIQVIEKLQIKESIQSKWVQGENIAQTFQFVATGNADIGFIALSQIIQNTSLKGSLWIIPNDFYLPIKQDAVILKKAQSNQAAISFVDFIKQKQTQEIIESYGYIIPKNN